MSANEPPGILDARDFTQIYRLAYMIAEAD